MRWTKRHSQNAVAAKARKRTADDEIEIEPPRRVYHPRRIKPDFTVRIEDRFGSRVQISVVRCFGRVMTSDGQSARQFCRGLEQLLSKSA